MTHSRGKNDEIITTTKGIKIYDQRNKNVDIKFSAHDTYLE